MLLVVDFRKYTTKGWACVVNWIVVWQSTCENYMYPGYRSMKQPHLSSFI